jgi:glutamate synthase (NADPH/NADH) small chain
VVVIGGGNTAIDIAVQTKRLGAEDVTIVYRRGPGQMGATHHEQEFAQVNGVKIKHWARPVRAVGMNGHVAGVEFEYTALDASGRLVGTKSGFTLAADQLFKAIGQTFIADPVVGDAAQPLELRNGRILVNEARATSLPGVYAGGDCVAGVDLTVAAVEDGKIAAHAIDQYLRGLQAGA